MINEDTVVLINDAIPVKLLCDNPTFWDYCITNPGIIVAIISLIVSIVAIIYSVVYNRRTLIQSDRQHQETADFNRETLKLTQENYKLSVEPIIVLDQVHDDRKHKLAISNNGLGPALIQSVDFIYKNDKPKKYVIDIYEKHFKEFIEAILPNKSKTGDVGENYCVKPNGSFLCYEITHVGYPDGFFEFQKLIRIVVKYKTIYGESRELDTFLREDKNDDKNTERAGN